MQITSVNLYIISCELNNSNKNSGEINMREEENSYMSEDIKYLEKVFKKWTPHMLSSPYIPTPSVLIKGPELPGKAVENKKRLNIPPTTKPIKEYSEKRYDKVLNCLHKGAYAYSIGDYGTAINYFTRLLGIEWLNHSTYFYLVKTLIKLDIEKEILSLQNKVKTTNLKTTKSE